MPSSKDSYILIEDSRNLDDDVDENNPEKEEPKEASSKALENSGIFVEEGESEDEDDSSLKNDFSKELMDQTGVEIIPTDDKEDERGEEW